MYIIGFDGGGSKTRCVVGDYKGNILADILGGPSNHQSCGPQETKRVINSLLDEALDASSLSQSDLSYAFLGLAGADLPDDFKMLYSLLEPVFKEIPIKIVNDAWIIMRSGTKSPWGAVCICGTGSNSGAAHPDGNQAILRSLGYDLGNYGGGGDMASEALHYAFRADEKTGPGTMLEEQLPAIFGLADMDKLVGMFYPKRVPDIYPKIKEIPPLVFELASKGDRVCQDILISMGDILGDMTAGVIKRVNIQDMEVPVVLGGSVFSGENPLFIDAFKMTIHRTAPRAHIILPDLAPVAGAYLYGLDTLKIATNKQVYDNLAASI
ncbi:MAG TPA: BadF/BadG/BcrA/BcrD ATPase family protein [Bacillota bacterium]|nr:BadF/BadG/BcrA/BcrD ATPase family protein [Bacillota bacterium]